VLRAGLNDRVAWRVEVGSERLDDDEQDEAGLIASANAIRERHGWRASGPSAARSGEEVRQAAYGYRHRQRNTRAAQPPS
jgi:hypothetical protein